MHELIRIWKNDANETNLKTLNPVIGSFSGHAIFFFLPDILEPDAKLDG